MTPFETCPEDAHDFDYTNWNCSGPYEGSRYDDVCAAVNARVVTGDCESSVTELEQPQPVIVPGVSEPVVTFNNFMACNRSAKLMRTLYDLALTRRAVGIKRYGRVLHTFDTRCNPADIMDEIIDAVVYTVKFSVEARVRLALRRRRLLAAYGFGEDGGRVDKMHAAINDAEQTVHTTLGWALESLNTARGHIEAAINAENALPADVMYDPQPEER